MILKKVITLFISGIVFLITIEFSARIDDKIKYGAPFFSEYSAKLLRNKDSEGINCNIPNSHFEKWKINNLGFRGPNISVMKPKGVIRIVCMGTSETFGLYESPDMEWPSQLSKMLEKYNYFEVINTSVVGLPLKKYRRYIEKYVLKLEPDIIILFVNPFEYGVGNEIFTKRQDTLKKEGKSFKNRGIHFLKVITYSNLRMFPKLKQSLKKIVPTSVLKQYQLWNMKRQIQKLENTYLNGNKPLDIIPNKNLIIFRNDLKDLIEYLQNKKIKIILTSYPILITQQNIDKYLEIFLDHRRFYTELSLQGIIDASRKFNEEIRLISNKHGVAFIDNNMTIPKNTQYFADNVHYTDEGARLIALNFSKYICHNKSRLMSQNFGIPSK